jgi:very-short-patch-repair endonuclease
MADKGMLTTRARAMRKQPSRAEAALWDIVRDPRLGVKFRRQFPIDRYIADFASVEAKLIVEIDGLSHENEDQAAYDLQRDAALAALGCRVLRVRDTLVLTAPNQAIDLVRDALR